MAKQFYLFILYCNIHDLDPNGRYIQLSVKDRFQDLVKTANIFNSNQLLIKPAHFVCSNHFSHAFTEPCIKTHIVDDCSALFQIIYYCHLYLSLPSRTYLSKKSSFMSEVSVNLQYSAVNFLQHYENSNGIK